MFVDSHCHLDFPELSERLENVLANMAERGVTHALTISVTREDYPKVRAIAEQHSNIWCTVGVHPDTEPGTHGGEPSREWLTDEAKHPKVVAIGETGLDYYRLTGDLEWQRDRFRTHIRAAREAKLPLVIHTRSASEDTLRIMREENAAEAGGVMHCFTETQQVADAAMDMGFYISMSGIVTFKNAKAIQDVARQVPLDRLLIETDSPYLAPVPHRGKTNEPGFVRHVAEYVADLRGISLEALAEATRSNFGRLFRVDV